MWFGHRPGKQASQRQAKHGKATCQPAQQATTCEGKRLAAAAGRQTRPDSDSGLWHFGKKKEKLLLQSCEVQRLFRLAVVKIRVTFLSCAPLFFEGGKECKMSFWERVPCQLDSLYFILFHVAGPVEAWGRPEDKSMQKAQLDPGLTQ